MTITEMVAKIQEEHLRQTGVELPESRARAALAHTLAGWRVNSVVTAIAFVVFKVDAGELPSYPPDKVDEAEASEEAVEVTA